MSAGGIAAPFVDAAGVALLAGGGTRLLGGGFGWAAGGGQSVLRSARPSTSDAPAAVLLVLHAYDGVTGDPWVQVRPTATPLTPSSLCRSSQTHTAAAAAAVDTTQVVELQWPASPEEGASEQEEPWPRVVPWEGPAAAVP